ncbi:PREDICTED: uncharacterized protein LOC101300101 [Fragaria vesca subsp. vesca]|uniref:uncharacterized protein LOC101300101 n=1 Tax=Fragaria vesca subsp. vesca TaxID=101020 RepID=UPI0002C2F584|nr:PREDICTED: uncharacterized protein LOC101300101 [Fragaria vesca subsp. vesca]
MAGEKKIEKAEPVATVLASDSVNGLGEPQLVSGKEGKPYDAISSMTSSRDATHSIKGETDQESVGEHGVYYPPTSCYNYYYPGYNGSYTQLDEHRYANASNSHTGVQSDNGSMVYYLPSYNPYAPGTLMGVDGQGVGQQQYYSSSATNSGFGNLKSGPGGTTLSRSSGYKANGNLASKFSKPFPSTQPIKSLNKVPYLGSDFSAGLLKGYPSTGRFSSFTNQKGLFPLNGEANYRSNGRILNVNDRFKSRDKFNRNEDFESSTELTRGPRSRNKSPPSDSAVEKEVLGFTVSRDKYNLPDFQTDYESAKFYVIKSYSEDDVHKSIKYDVWASTPNGNKKLDAAFRDAEAKSSETGKRCPIFLFFSVNGSGQFVGLAEMIGEVDFNKDMDFWQVDKWSGFFPVNWHVVKDIPNTQLRHIILDQFLLFILEIAVNKGLTFDFDFDFMNVLQKHMNTGGEDFEAKSGGIGMTSDRTSLISLTKNLSLNA